jgi:hypothetical protein
MSIFRQTGGQLFNDYHAWWLRVSKPTDQILDEVVTVRIRGFGSDADKQRAWDRDWRSQHPTWGPVSQVTVSSAVPEVWMDLRQTEGGLFLPPHIVGHEMGHVLRLQDGRVIDPDTFAVMK